jgi:hypothetical protein
MIPIQINFLGCIFKAQLSRTILGNIEMYLPMNAGVSFRNFSVFYGFRENEHPRC